MDQTSAAFSGIGMLTTAYLLGYPVYFFIGRPLLWVTERMSKLRMTLEIMNIEMDIRNGRLPFLDRFDRKS